MLTPLEQALLFSCLATQRVYPFETIFRTLHDLSSHHSESFSLLRSDLRD